ncbi:uncharacterized protein V1510DRAFT_403876 [Dipodascopsis tothii]|uniref:uncharacterized protein n=1 Tax=Dipodascopsis tothii TaxID=44089 RepID=UPI0034CFDE9D
MSETDHAGGPMDAIEQRIMGLRSRLAAEGPYYDPQNSDEYVTYLSPRVLQGQYSMDEDDGDVSGLALDRPETGAGPEPREPKEPKEPKEPREPKEPKDKDAKAKPIKKVVRKPKDAEPRAVKRESSTERPRERSVDRPAPGSDKKPRRPLEPLPEMLSPTLPAQFDADELPNTMLSPTLPPAFADVRAPSRIVVLRHPALKKRVESRKRPTDDDAAADAKRRRSVLVDERKPKAVPKTKPREPRPAATPPPETPQTPGVGKKRPAEGSAKKVRDEASPRPDALPEPTAAQREDMAILTRKFQKWSMLGADRKHEGDSAKKAGNVRQACLLAMDALIAYFVAFDYEDKSNSIRGRYPTDKTLDKSWQTLARFVPFVVKTLEEARAVPLVGLAYQLRAIISMRMAYLQQSAGRQLTEAAADAPTLDALLEINAFTARANKNYEQASYEFRRGTKLLPLSAIQDQLPATWARASRDPLAYIPPSGAPSLRPLDDSFHLPLHMFSTLREAAAFAYSAVREWADKNKLPYESVLLKGVAEGGL